MLTLRYHRGPHLAALAVLALVLPPSRASVSVGAAVQPSGFDSRAMTAAIDGARPGDTVQLPEDTFVLTEPIRPKSGIKLVGAGQDKTRLVYQGSQPGVLIGFSECEDVEVAHLTLDGLSNPLVRQGISGANSRRLWLHHLTIRNLVKTGSLGPHAIFFSGRNPSMEGGVTDSRITDCRTTLIVWDKNGRGALAEKTVQVLPPAAALGLPTQTGQAAPPEGFVPLFDGKTLAGWTVRQPDNRDWSIVDGVIDCDPKDAQPGDRNLWTVRDYGDFELLVDWRIKESPYVNRDTRIILPDGTYKKDAAGNEIAITVPNTDSGVFLRGQHKSQVNIWCWPVGSGEVWGYRTDPKVSAEVRAGVTPKVRADRPVGQWNTFHITMKGDRLSVKLNGVLVIDNARLPGVPPRGPIALQQHGDRKDGTWGVSLVQFRNIHIKE